MMVNTNLSDLTNMSFEQIDSFDSCGTSLSESQCKDTTFLIPNSPMLIVAHRYSPIITDRVMLHKYDT